MSNMLQFVAENGMMFVTGATGLLLIGTVAQWLTSSLIHKQRICEFTLVAFLLGCF